MSAVVLVVFGITVPCHVNCISFSPIFIRTFKSIICIQCMFCLTNLLCLFLSDELVPGDTKPKLDLQSDKKKGSRTLTSWILHQSYLLLFTVGPDSGDFGFISRDPSAARPEEQWQWLEFEEDAGW